MLCNELLDFAVLHINLVLLLLCFDLRSGKLVSYRVETFLYSFALLALLKDLSTTFTALDRLGLTPPLQIFQLELDRLELVRQIFLLVVPLRQQLLQLVDARPQILALTLELLRLPPPSLISARRVISALFCQVAKPLQLLRVLLQKCAHVLQFLFQFHVPRLQLAQCTVVRPDRAPPPQLPQLPLSLLEPLFELARTRITTARPTLQPVELALKLQD